MTKTRKHFLQTRKLATQIDKHDLFNWLISTGYYPENYVLPPVFYVSKYANSNRAFYKQNKNSYKPTIFNLMDIHFPKTKLTDRTFSIIEPTIIHDISYLISDNWNDIIKILFNSKNLISSYSFPIPLDAKNPGKIGNLRSGRMIYEYIEMAEKDLVDEAFQFQYLVKTDIKNFYPSIYTHSIAWSIHGKKTIRSNRNNFSLYGNKLDKLFQNANDGCTNGIPIGPAVSDLISEIILSKVDLELSKQINSSDFLCVRFKDDYRILCKKESDTKFVIKKLQFLLKSYNLTMNESKTTIDTLPNGLFRNWTTDYHNCFPKKKKLSFKEFRCL